MLDKLRLGTVFVTTALAAVVACSSTDSSAPGDGSDGGSGDGSTTDASTTSDAATRIDAADAAKPDAAAACTGSQFYDGTACKPCSGACPAGSRQTAACSASADRTCSTCTTIAHCATETCTTATDQVCAACASTYYLSGNTCAACSGACPVGQEQTAACTATTDRVCTSCTPIPNCINITCSNAMDQVCSACAPGYYLSGNACVACSGACAAGEYQTAACAATADRTCAACTSVTQCASALTCTTATNSQCTACNAGYYRVDGVADTCATCSGACPAGKYESAACGGTTDRVCSSCTAIPNCTSALTCTTVADQQCTTCASGYALVEGSPDICARAATCADIKRNAPGATDGVYTIDPDGAGGLAPFQVYCDMTTNGGGWTLIGKVGNGQWPELTNQQYIDLVANPIADVGGALLLDGTPPATKDIAFFRKDRTNAMYHAKPFAGESVVRVIFDSAQDDAVDGTYFQQRKVADAAWDFWSALRDSRRWSSAASGPTWVSNFGVDFALTRTVASFNTATNSVTHDTGGDTDFGYWDTGTLTLADATTLVVSRHGGLMCDGVNNYGWLWLLTFNPSDSRFKNESFNSKSTIWLR